MDALDLPVRRWRRVVQACAGVAALIGGLALVGWLTGSSLLRGWGLAHDAMTPDTGFLLLAAGLSLLLLWGKPAWGAKAVQAFAILAILIAGDALREYFTGADLKSPLPLPDTPGELLAPVRSVATQMGLVTAVLFFICSAGLLLVVSGKVQRRVKEAAASCCGVIVASAGLVHALGFLYGRPLRYGSRELQVPLNGALAFFALGVALALTPVIRDLARRRLERRRLSAQYAATRTLVESDSLTRAGERLLKELCEGFGWAHGVLWTRDASRGLLRCMCAHSSPDAPELDKLTALTRGGAFARGVGLPGRAWAAREVVAIEDPTQDSEFARRAAASNAGLYGGFAVPIHAGADEVLGVFEFLHPQVEVPSPQTRALVEAVASQAALYIRRKQAEQALGDEHNLLRAVIDNLPDHIFLKDTKGHYVLDNIAHMRFLGMTSTTQLIGKTVRDFFPAEESAKFEADDQSVISTGQPIFNREECRTDANGVMQWLATSKLPFHDESGKLIGLICVSRDITARKEAEEALQEAQLQLIQAEKLESLGRLAAGIAHEVKNPLALILMGADFLDAELADHHVGGSAPEVVGQIREAAWRADGIIRGMLDFSAPNKMLMQPTDVNDLLHKSLPLIRHEMDAANVALKTEFAEDLPPASLDLNKIQQVFINVCTNAVHAMPEGGTLTVRTALRALDAREVAKRDAGSRVNERLRVGDSAIFIEIDDTGTGVPPEKLAYIFEPFYTTKPTGKGTGLGLSVTRKIVEMHGGEIRISNRREGGARVTLLFRPAGREVSAAPAATEIAAA